MDTNLTLELFIGRGMIDKSLAKDIKEEMATSGKNCRKCSRTSASLATRTTSGR